MRKGAPSINPTGRSAAELAAITKAAQAPGFDGVQASYGYVSRGETDARLQGTRRYKAQANLFRQCPPVPIWARLRDRLLSGITWTLTPNPAGGPAAELGVKLVTEGLLNARLGAGALTRPWSKVAARAMNGAAWDGFSLHATAMQRRTRDGLIVYTDIAQRPQATIDRWFREREDDASPFVRVEQRTTSGATAQLLLRDCLYVINDNGTNSESPMGVGVFDHIVERARQLNVYESIIGTEISSSMGGIPVARAPLQEMKEALGWNKDLPEAARNTILAAVSEKTRSIREFLAKRIKDPLTLAWLELDSATYRDDANAISSVNKWGVEIIKPELQGVTESQPIAREYLLDIARMLGVEHVFVGGGDTAGTYGMHESNIGALGADLSAEARLFAVVGDDQLVRPLIAANGLDPDTAAPSLTASPIMRADVLKAVQALAQLNLAGLPPNHPAKRQIFEAVDLEYQEEQAPRLTLPSFTAPPTLDDVLDPPTAEQALRLRKKGATP